jgi:hypothetical protein
VIPPVVCYLLLKSSKGLAWPDDNNGDPYRPICAKDSPSEIHPNLLAEIMRQLLNARKSIEDPFSAIPNRESQRWI